MDASIPTIQFQEISPLEEALQNECLPSLLRTGGEVRRQCSPRKSAETGQDIETVEAIYPPNAEGHGELLSPVQHVQQHDLVEHRPVQDCQQGVVRSDYILTTNRSTALAEHGV